jgi:hypothetical protein
MTLDFTRSIDTRSFTTESAREQSRGGQSIDGSETKFKALERTTRLLLLSKGHRLLLYTVHLSSCAVSDCMRFRQPLSC